jgi:hypothetical protein
MHQRLVGVWLHLLACQQLGTTSKGDDSKIYMKDTFWRYRRHSIHATYCKKRYVQIPQDTVRKLENGMTWQKIWWFKWPQKVAAIQMKQEPQVIHVGHCVIVPNGSLPRESLRWDIYLYPIHHENPCRTCLNRIFNCDERCRDAEKMDFGEVITCPRSTRAIAFALHVIDWMNTLLNTHKYNI